MKKSLTRLLALILTLVVLLSSCAPTPPVVCDEHFDGTRDGLCDFCGEEVLPDSPTPDNPNPDDPTPDNPDEPGEDGPTLPDLEDTELPDGGSEPESPALTYTYLTSIPDYVDGTEFTVLNGGMPTFTKNQLSTNSYEFYSELDSLGRCGIAVAVLSKDTMPADGEERGNIDEVIPSGWFQKKYDANLVPTTWIFHRSHLIAWSLSAENANAKNLITGTQFFNQNCMTEFESMVQDYIKETGNHVLYRVVPYFVGDELVPRGVHMEGYSVEDSGEGICYSVFIHNVQKDIVIDYSNGYTRHIDEEDENLDSEKPGDYTYIINKNSGVIHIEGCSSANKMSEANKIVCDDKTLAELLETEGYKVCGICGARPKD